MLATIFGFAKLLINPIDHIAGKIAEYKIAQQNAKTDQDRIQADERVKALEAKRDVLVAEARNPWNTIMRGALALPVVIILWKVMAYDKTIGGTTTMSPDLWHVVWVVLGFYFLDNITRRIWR